MSKEKTERQCKDLSAMSRIELVVMRNYLLENRCRTQYGAEECYDKDDLRYLELLSVVKLLNERISEISAIIYRIDGKEEVATIKPK